MRLKTIEPESRKTLKSIIEPMRSLKWTWKRILNCTSSFWDSFSSFSFSFKSIPNNHDPVRIGTCYSTIFIGFKYDRIRSFIFLIGWIPCLKGSPGLLACKGWTLFAFDKEVFASPFFLGTKKVWALKWRPSLGHLIQIKTEGWVDLPRSWKGEVSLLSLPLETIEKIFFPLFLGLWTYYVPFQEVSVELSDS